MNIEKMRIKARKLVQFFVSEIKKRYRLLNNSVKEDLLHVRSEVTEGIIVLFKIVNRIGKDTCVDNNGENC